MKRKILSVLLALVLVLSFSLVPAAPASATSTTNNDAAAGTGGPGQAEVLVMDFTINDGGDILITEAAPTPGTAVISFSDNVEMYVDQGTTANTYEDGEDILLVSVIRDGAASSILDGQEINNFNANTRYTDNNTGSSYTDGEAIIITSDTTLDSGDTLLTPGAIDSTAFASTDYVWDDSTTGTDDNSYQDAEAIISDSVSVTEA